MYGPTEIGRLRVIRMLCLAGYSRMPILRCLSRLDRGQAGPADARGILDRPEPTGMSWFLRIPGLAH